MAEHELKNITVDNPPAQYLNSSSVDPSSQPSQPTLSKIKKWLSSPYFWCFLISFFVKALIVGLLLGLYYKHVNPLYQIDDVHVKISPVKYPDYEITLKARNKNRVSTLDFDQEGDASLFSGSKEIARGKYPKFEEHPGNSHDVTMILHGSTALPVIQSSLNLMDVRENVPLFLSIDAPMKVKIGALKVKTKNIKVKCSLTVQNLDSDATILRQNCVSEG